MSNEKNHFKFNSFHYIDLKFGKWSLKTWELSNDTKSTMKDPKVQKVQSQTKQTLI